MISSGGNTLAAWKMATFSLCAHVAFISLVPAFGDREAERLSSSYKVASPVGIWISPFRPGLTLCVCVCSVMSDSLRLYGLQGVVPCRGLARQAPPSTEFSRRDILEWVALFLLQSILPTQRLNPHLWHCRQIFYHCSIWKDPFNLNYLLKSPISSTVP